MHTPQFQTIVSVRKKHGGIAIKRTTVHGPTQKGNVSRKTLKQEICQCGNQTTHDTINDIETWKDPNYLILESLPSIKTRKIVRFKMLLQKQSKRTKRKEPDPDPDPDPDPNPNPDPDPDPNPNPDPDPDPNPDRNPKKQGLNPEKKLLNLKGQSYYPDFHHELRARERRARAKAKARAKKKSKSKRKKSKSKSKSKKKKSKSKSKSKSKKRSKI